eukprot:Gb_29080 [translate_table: standard]
MPTKRVLCKYFMDGACLKQECCEFSHDLKYQPNSVCRFYQKGGCHFGSRCRYDHVKVSFLPNEHFMSSSSQPRPVAEPRPTTTSGGMLDINNTAVANQKRQLSALSRPFIPPSLPSSDLANLPICAFAAVGKCPLGDGCPYLHGHLCSTCGKNCLHPYRLAEREEHIQQCQSNQKRLQRLQYSQEIECIVCLERVLSKPEPAERKFGLLSECDHAFCISCIRNWRKKSPTSGMDGITAKRSCPLCRKSSHFVIPSLTWYLSPEEKEEIVDNYKRKLSSMDCKYFDSGNGSCPFGTSCFYKHARKDGGIEEIMLCLRDGAYGCTANEKKMIGSRNDYGE